MDAAGCSPKPSPPSPAGCPDTAPESCRRRRAITRRPVYSTWYTFTQDIDTEAVLSEATLAAHIGCGSVFIDDGWQLHGTGRGYQGCGDWVADSSKFADLAGTVASIHESGLQVGLWVAPLLLGADSAAHSQMASLAPQWIPDLNCFVLDPRRPAVREHVIELCLRMVQDYGVDLLKIDFLDQAMVYRDTVGGGDMTDVGQAMWTMLGQLRGRLVAVGRGDIAFEFRQPYVSPAIARFGEILRANDCPADSGANRASTVDARLTSVGQIVHADPMMWGAGGGTEAVAQQIYNAWFAVPQISMRLSTLGGDQIDAVRGLLDFWLSLAEVTLDGVLDVRGSENGYHLVRADSGERRSVVARYAPITVDLGEGEITVLNACSDTRVVVRTARPVTGGVVRSSAATPIRTVGPFPAGLVEIDVPAFGSLTVTTT